MQKKIKFIKFLTRPIEYSFHENNTLNFNGFFINKKLKLKKNSLFMISDKKVLIYKHI